MLKVNETHRRLSAQIVLIITVTIGIYFVIDSLPFNYCSTKQSTITLLGIIPNKYLINNTFLTIAKALYVCFGILWIIGFSRVSSSLLSTLFFIITCSISIQGGYYTKHMYHPVAIFLIIYCAHECFYSNKGKHLISSFPKKTPPWLFSLPIFYFITIYTYSGVNKVLDSWPIWIDGISMQLWIITANIDNNLIAEILIKNRFYCQVLLVLTLIAETLVGTILFIPKLSFFFGTLIIGFHVGTYMIFGFDFFANIILGTYAFFICPILLDFKVLNLFDS